MSASEAAPGRTPKTQPHVVILRATEIRWNTRLKKMALSLSRLGLRVTIIAWSDLDETTRLGACDVIRVAPARAHAQALNERRRERRRKRINIAPSQATVDYLALRRRTVRLQRDALRGRSGTGSRGALRKMLLTAEFVELGLRRRFDRARRSMHRSVNDSLTSWWKRHDDRRKARAEARRSNTRVLSWRRELLAVREYELRLADLIDELKPDVLHAHNLHMLGLAVDAAARARRRGRSVRVVYDSTEYWAGVPVEAKGARRHESFLLLEREYIGSADGVIATTEPIAEALQKRYRLKRRPTVMMNVPLAPRERAPITTARETIGLDPAVPLVMYSGIIAAGRGVETIVDALAALPGVHLGIVAVPWPNPNEASLRETAARAGVSDRVHLVPPVDPDDIIPFLRGATVGVHPLVPGSENHEMTLPNKLFEYAFAGLRLVVSNVRAMSAFVREHRLGEVFPYGDRDALVAALARALQAPPGTYLEGEEFERWRARYSWEGQESGLAELYGRVLGSPLAIDGAQFPSLEEAPR